MSDKDAQKRTADETDPLAMNPEERAAWSLEKAMENLGAVDEGEEIIVLDKKLQQREETEKVQAAIQAEVKEEPEVTAREELEGRPILEPSSEREKLRLLILTRDLSLAGGKGAARDRIRELAQMFAEVHVIILTQSDIDLKNVVRIADNVWLYKAYSKYWWKVGFNAYRIARKQLEFSQGFRADIIIAEDPFESGTTGYYIAEKYNRPFQVHVFDDYFDPFYKFKERHNDWRIFLARFNLKRADCVRVRSESLKHKLGNRYPTIAKYIEVLPTYYDLRAWKETEPAFDLKKKFPQYKFFMLHITSMTARAHTDRVIAGAGRVLSQYPTVGLVVVGDGPEREELEKNVEELGLKDKVVFESASKDLISYMKSADILLHFSEDPDDEYIMLVATAVGLPIIAGSLGLARELFIDGESAFLCPIDSPPCVHTKISRFLNENDLRVKLSRNAEEVVFSRIEQNFDAYLESYRDSIERCVSEDS